MSEKNSDFGDNAVRKSANFQVRSGLCFRAHRYHDIRVLQFCILRELSDVTIRAELAGSARRIFCQLELENSPSWRKFELLERSSTSSNIKSLVKLQRKCLKKMFSIFFLYTPYLKVNPNTKYSDNLYKRFKIGHKCGHLICLSPFPHSTLTVF